MLFTNALIAAIDLSRVFLTPDYYVEHISATPANASCGIRVDSDGLLYIDQNGSGFVASHTWMLQGPNTAFDVMLETGSGTLSSGTADTWQVCSSDRTYTVSIAVVGVRSFTGTLKLRDSSTLEVLKTATVSLYAEEA